MSNAYFQLTQPINDPIRNYEPGSPDKALLKQTLAQMQSEEIEVPIFIGGQEIRTGNIAEMRAPHDHSIKLGIYHKAGEAEVKLAIESALDARSDWAAMPWEHRLSIFLKAAELLAGPWRPDYQRGHHAGPIQDRLPGGDRRSLRIGRLLALQCLLHDADHGRAAHLRAGDVESGRVQTAGGFCVCGHALQLHIDRSQPAHGPGHGRQCGAVETRIQRRVLGLLHLQTIAGGRCA